MTTPTASTDYCLRCVGGPLHGKRLRLEEYQSGTLTFTLKGQSGRYIYQKHETYFNTGSYLLWRSQPRVTTISAQATA